MKTVISLYFTCRRFRYIAYGQLVRWCWVYLGKHVRVALPSCAVNKVRRTFRSSRFWHHVYRVEATNPVRDKKVIVNLHHNYWKCVTALAAMGLTYTKTQTRFAVITFLVAQWCEKRDTYCSTAVSVQGFSKEAEGGAGIDSLRSWIEFSEVWSYSYSRISMTVN